jgi:hypothetical protein
LGTDVIDSPELDEVLGDLECFLPSILAEVYSYWKNESLDGIFLSEARKIDSCKAELAGACILMSDQSVTLLNIRLKVSACEEKIEWMECRLGKRGEETGEMECIPYARWRHKALALARDPIESIDWVYKVTFGEASAES